MSEQGVDSLTKAGQQQNPIRTQSRNPWLIAQPAEPVALGSYKPEAEKSLVSSGSLFGAVAWVSW